MEDQLDRNAIKELLLRLAANYRWTWRRSCRDLLISLPGAGADVHPLQTVNGLRNDDIDRLLADDDFVATVMAEADSLDQLGRAQAPRIAYFSMEYAISGFLHQYAGGLGVLAGDHLKAASDAAMPLVGVGLFYRDGGFRQILASGTQVERFETVDPGSVGAFDTGLRVEVPLQGRDVEVAIRRIDVGGVPLILLDTNLDSNHEHDRNITDRLYLGDAGHRVDQEMVLGVGGARALVALGFPIEVFHLNEGHAGFAALELIDGEIGELGLDAAVERVRRSLVFTTHTPVPAGIDRIDRKTLEPHLIGWAERWNVDPAALWDLGQDPVDDKFNMAVFCLRTSRSANGVSELHGHVSRDLFADVSGGTSITHVTNGVHARTWTAPGVQDVFDEALGDGWDRGDDAAWGRVGRIGLEVVGSLRRRRNPRLIDHLTRSGETIDPESFIVGFARRFAPYKRATLLLRNRERLIEMLNDSSRPTHLLFAGKAHPANDAARELLEELAAFADSPQSNGRVTFIPDYDMDVGAAMVQGCDIWLNNPVRLREASGTSGEKAALNGVLNCSILDGWWAEMYDGTNGWSISTSDAGSAQQRDDEESAAALSALEAARDEFFGSRDTFNERIRHAWRTLGPRVTAARMVEEYRRDVYKV